MRPAGVLLSATLVLLSLGALAAEDYPQVRPGVALKFPRDHGSHPRFRNEWWYITGWLRTSGGGELGVQITFFRYALRFEAKQPPLLQGERGFSRKGPGPAQASYYYSLPHLSVSGSVVIEGSEREVSGEAWLDHEWSSEPLAEEAVGWDWIGINLADGGALMAFRMRAKDSGGSLWAGGAVRSADGRVRILKPGEVRFEPLRRWRSPRTGAEYPVAVRVQAGALTLELEPLMDDQELDARASTGTGYWEGAIRAGQGERALGRGYLELTGYWRPLKP